MERDDDDFVYHETRRGKTVYTHAVPADSYFVDPARCRTRQSHPYSYDAFYHWRDADLDGSESVDHDRLRQQKPEAWRAAWTAIRKKDLLSLAFPRMSRRQIDRFLSVVLGKPVRAVALIESCNLANGYPVYSFRFRPKAVRQKRTKKPA